MARRRRKGEERQIAARRVGVLLASARQEVLGPDRDLADRHTQIARRVAMRYQLQMRPHERAQFCRACGTYRSSETTRVRLRAGRLATTCLRCGHIHRRPLNGQQETA